MSLHMQSQMIRPGKCAFTKSALKRPISRMLSIMSGQLIRPGKFPATAFPVALVRFLPRVRSQMCFQMRGFSVGFDAASISTGMGGHLFPSPSSSTPLWFGWGNLRRYWGCPICRSP